MTGADGGSVHQPTMSPAFDPETTTYTVADTRVSLSDTKYYYKVSATPLYYGNDVDISIAKTSGDGVITVDGDTFTWVPSAGAGVTATVTVTNKGEDITYTITMNLVGRVS